MARTSRFLAPLLTLVLLLSAATVMLPPQQVLAANEVWDVRMEFTADPTGGNWLEPNPLVFGSSATATTGFDGAPNDIVAPGAAPAPNDAYAYFTTSGSNCREERQPYLGSTPGDSCSWSLRLIADSAGASSLNLDWGDISSVASFPLDATIILSGGGQTIDMRAQDTATYAPGSNYNLTITVTRLGTPNEVWVDDDWDCDEPAAAGDAVTVGSNSLILGYNAFCDIQDGVDAIEADEPSNGGIVHVLSSEGEARYSAFTVSENNVQVLGTAGAVVQGSCGEGCRIQTAGTATGIVVDRLVFNGGTVYCLCPDTGNVTLSNLEVIGSLTTGIVVDTSMPDSTVYIKNPVIHGFIKGISAKNDSVEVTNPNIYDCVYGIYADSGSNVTVEGGLIHYEPLEPTEPGLPDSYGIYVTSSGKVTVRDCCTITRNDYGIYVVASGILIANGNNIYDNSLYGVWWGGSGTVPDCKKNWWGDEEGPILNTTSNPPRDGINDSSILYSPWLDGECPSGDPVGINAKFKGVARSGEPGLKVEFTDLSTPAPGCEIDEWLWEFGDGDTSDEQNPSHVYTREGVFTVTLTVTDSCHYTSTVTMKAYITIAKEKEREGGEPANMVVSYLLIDPLQVLPGQEVVVSGNICNQGDERGTKTVSLMVNGNAEQSQTVGVSGGSCQQVTFRLSRAVPGTYQVAIDGMTGQFSVLAPKTVTNNVPSKQDTGLGTAGIIAIIAIAIALVAALIFLFRR